MAFALQPRKITVKPRSGHRSSSQEISPLFNGTRMFITAFTSARQLSLSDSKLLNLKWVNSSSTLTNLFSSKTVCYTKHQIADFYTQIITYSNWPLRCRYAKWKGDVIVITVGSKIESHHLCSLRISKRIKNVVVEEFCPSSPTVFRRSELILNIKNK